MAEILVEGGTASLSLTGEIERELTTEPAPKLAEPEPEAEPDRSSPVLQEGRACTYAEGQIHIDPALPYLGVTVDCPDSGLRYRVPFVAGLAVLPELARGDRCRAYFRGAGPPLRISIQAGEKLACAQSESYDALLCHPHQEGAPEP